VSLLAIGCEAVVKNLDSPSQESRSDFIASKLTPTGKQRSLTQGINK